MINNAKFPKGVPMTIDEVAEVVGDEFKTMNENPPDAVLKVREEMMGKTATRQRLTWSRAAATEPGGLYGMTKAIQHAAEVASRKLARRALRLARTAFAKDEQVVPFLQMHAKREGSKSARVLLAAMREIGPKVASELRGGRPKEAGAPTYGLYGFKARTADLGLDACKNIRAHAGHIAADLHRRKMEAHGALTGFFKEHCKTAKCAYAGLLLSCYPDATTRVASSGGHLAGVPTYSGNTSVDLMTGRVHGIIAVDRRDSEEAHPLGHLRDVELLPSQLRGFYARLQREAPAGTRPIISVWGTSDDLHISGREAEGSLRLAGRIPGAETVLGRVTYTAEFDPFPVAGDKTVLASGDWIEWEE